MKNTIEINQTLFWQMYNALRDAEGVLWECDGRINCEHLSCSIGFANKDISNVLDKLQPIISTLKEVEA